MQVLSSCTVTTWESVMRHGAGAALVSLALAASAVAQTTVPPRVTKEISLSGPRFGITALSNGNLAKLEERGIVVRPMISQFGWQFEKRFYSNGDGLVALSEWVPLIGGLEQGVVLPSLSWLVGVRTREGTEFGVGPNMTSAGVGMALAAGVTVRSGALNVPLNVAIVTSKSGTRVSMLTGFNFRR